MFFELIKKTRATVQFTGDGMVVSPGKLSEIKLHPRAYNQIGDFTAKIEEIKKSLASIEIQAIAKEYFPSTGLLGLNRCGKLNPIIGKSGEERVELLKGILQNDSKNFDIDEIQKAIDTELREALSKAIPIAPRMLPSAKNDLEEFRGLKLQELTGTLSEEDKQRTTELEANCEKHKKEYFFKSSADYANEDSYIDHLTEQERKKIREYKSAMDIVLLSQSNEEDSEIRNMLVDMGWEDDQV
ncbi:hypothetical protein FO519_009983, partial [Halicephalobus sp. NKZ332]